MKTKHILLIVLAAISVANAQKPDAKKAPLGPTRSVFNEDRGRGCIVVDTSLPIRRREKISVEPQQYSIFLGKGWAADSLRTQETILSNLLSDVTDGVATDYLERSGWKTSYSVNNHEEKLGDLGQARTVSDLQIQGLLSDTIKDSQTGRQEDDIIYIVYLEPALASSLASIVGGKHYISYYNAFNRSEIRIRYVVVPYDEVLKTTRKNALAGFLSAVLQPDCS